MSHNDGEAHGNDGVFLIEELGAVTSQDVVDWFDLRAHGTATPTVDTRPIARSDSLQHWKKALSCCMPNRNHQWDEIAGRGNPAKSQAPNDLIKCVERAEVRGQGAAPKAR